MARDSQSKFTEDASPGTPAWMTTFSDCMTLLLTFFVLLLSFSSFDRAALARLKGAFSTRPKETILEPQKNIGDSVVERTKSIIDRTEKGSEKPDLSSLEDIEHPKADELINDTSVYSSEKVFYISGTRLFWGDGHVLTRQGRELLGHIASLMKMMPCMAVVAQMQQGPIAAGKEDSRLLRSCAIIRFLTKEQGLQEERFRISVPAQSPPQRYRNEPVMQITLLARDITQ